MFSSKKISRLLLALSLLLSVYSLRGQKNTVVYATRDSIALKMDIYTPAEMHANNYCVIFVFGGGFFTGSRDANLYKDYFKSLTDSGYLVASIDYRLGLKNAKKPPSLFNRKPLILSINLAVEDLYTATDYLVDHADALKIDTGKFIVSGSSAGAITVLTADYRKRNGYDQKILPEAFQYAGVISFAGAIYSEHGHPEYAIHPAPMLLIHGNEDEVVPFKRVSLFGTGLYGSKSIIRDFKKIRAPYCLMVFDETGHAASTFPLQDNLPQIHAFLREYILRSRPLYIEASILNGERIDKKMDFNRAFKNKNER